MRAYPRADAAATAAPRRDRGPHAGRNDAADPNADPALSEALAAAGRGWRVLPVTAGGKVPRLEGWPDLASDDPEVIRRWAARSPGCNWGVLTGAGSGVVVLDVDPRNGGDGSLDRIIAEHGPLPEGPVALTGGGGRHHYFAHPGGKVGNVNGDRHGKGLDVKGDGGQVVLAGSVHESGARYGWAPSHQPDAVPLPEVPAWLLDSNGFGSARGADPDLTHAWDCNVLPVVPGLKPVGTTGGGTVDRRDSDGVRAIYATLPTRPGQRNRQVFEFARRLKAIAHLAGRTAADLRPLVREWHRLADEFTSGTHPADDTLADFATAWAKVHSPRGESLKAATVAAVAADDPPSLAALDYGADTRFVVRLARELQRLRPGEPFALAARIVVDAAAAAGHSLSVDTAAARLRLIVSDGVLALAVPADRVKRRAAEYRYRLPERPPTRGHEAR